MSSVLRRIKFGSSAVGAGLAAVLVAGVGCTARVNDPGNPNVDTGATGGTGTSAGGAGGAGATGGTSGAAPGVGGAAPTGGAGGTGATQGSGGTLGGGAGAGGVSGAPSACVGTEPRAAALHARLLSPGEFDNAVEDLVKVTGQPSKAFAAGAAAQLDATAAEVRANVAADIARQAASSLATWAPCTPPGVPEAACRDQIIEQVGGRAYRRVLTSTEHAELVSLFDAGTAEKDFATGVEWFLSGLFQSPDFLYEHARVAPTEVAGQVVALSSTELASRLSFFLWASPPDDELRAAGTALSTPAAVDAQVSRMMADPRFERSLDAFYTSWLRLSGLRDVARNDPGFTTPVVDALRRSIHLSVTNVYAAPAPTFNDLLVGESYFMDSTLRSFYGVGGPGGSDFAPVTMAGEGRRGLLTHPTLMALLAKEDHSNPIARGLFTLRSLLCQDVPPPDGVAIPAFPEEAENLSTRDRLEQHVSDPVCSGCHSQFDGLGYAYENFDEVGRYRAMDGGRAVDSSGTVDHGVDFDGPFANGAELFAKMAESSDAKRCFARRYFEYAVARRAATQDACTIEQVSQRFVQSADLKQLAVSIATSDALSHRLSEGAAQ